MKVHRSVLISMLNQVINAQSNQEKAAQYFTDSAYLATVKELKRQVESGGDVVFFDAVDGQP